MTTKIGLLSSNRTAVIHSLQKNLEEIKTALSRYSEQDLFEIKLMIEYLLLKARRKESPNRIWIQRLDSHLAAIEVIHPGTKRSQFMKRLNLPTTFDANRYARTLLFPWFR